MNQQMLEPTLRTLVRIIVYKCQPKQILKLFYAQELVVRFLYISQRGMGTITKRAFSRMFTIAKCNILRFRNLDFFWSKTSSLVRTVTERLLGRFPT